MSLIKASPDEIVEAMISILGDASEGNGYRLTTHKKMWWIEHRHVGSGEPFDQFIRDAIEKFVVEEEQTHSKSEVQAMFDPLRETINNQIKEIDSLRKEIDFYKTQWGFLSKKFNEVSQIVATYQATEKGGDDE